MTATDKSNIRSKYDHCDPQYLRDLRLAAGKSVEVLARTACLSVAQVRALESGEGSDYFYSNTIRQQAYKRLLMILGAQPPTIELPPQEVNPSTHALDEIAAMNKAQRTISERVYRYIDATVKHKYLLGSMIFLVAVVALVVLTQPMDWTRTWNELTVSPAQSVRAVVSEPVATTSMPVNISLQTNAPAVSAAVVVSSTDVMPSVAVSIDAAAKCEYSAKPMIALSPSVAKKEGVYVYLLSPIDTEVCVVDADKKATLVSMKAGMGRTIMGVAPWQISGAQLQQVQIYFQGVRVALPNESINAVKVVESDLMR